MDRLKLREIAVRHAALSGMVYAQAPDFEPHEWVLRALAEVAETPDEGNHIDAYNEGFDDGFRDGVEAGRDGA